MSQEMRRHLDGCAIKRGFQCNCWPKSHYDTKTGLMIAEGCSTPQPPAPEPAGHYCYKHGPNCRGNQIDCIFSAPSPEAGAAELQTAANELLRELNREIFNDQIDISKLPQAVGLVEDFAKLWAAHETQALRHWKESMIAVTPDWQEIGKELGVQLGESVHDKVLPAIRMLRSRIAELEREVRKPRFGGR